jgi:acyl phosphate:glycerol-3-phosphate acyltransferase
VIELAFLLLAYLIGSVPAGAWLARSYGIDIRTVGSGNTGATNILRSVGARPALLVALFDALKGGLAIVLARAVGIEGWVLGGVAVLAVLGHNFSLFLKFKGGKGVATSFGTLLFLGPLACLLSAAIFVSVVWLTRFVSAGSMVAALAACLFSVALASPLWQTATFSVLAALIFWTHRENIKRLRAGNERRFGEKTS